MQPKRYKKMTTNNKTIVFDIDGVLADFEGAFCEKFGYSNRNFIDLVSRYPEKEQEILKFISDTSSYEDLEPIFGGGVLLAQARQKGYKVVLLTSRPLWTKEVTEEWLKKYWFDYDDLYFAITKVAAINIMNDPKGAKKYNVVAIVDDIPGNIFGLPDGVFGVLWEQPWNADYYPKVRYSYSEMRTEIKFDTGSGWVDFWKGK